MNVSISAHTINDLWQKPAVNLVWIPQKQECQPTIQNSLEKKKKKKNEPVNCLDFKLDWMIKKGTGHLLGSVVVTAATPLK